MNRRENIGVSWPAGGVNINYSGSFDVRPRFDGHAKPEVNNCGGR
jgi:hypothetical protein